VPPPRTWDVFVPALLRHTEGRWAPLANTLAAAALAAGEPTGWFEPLYAAGEAGAVSMPWDSGKPTRMLVDWTRENVGAAEPGRRALVVGSATGEDAEHLAGLGYRTLGFDIAPTAVRVASARHPRSAVEYVVADLLDPPAEWRRGFDLVYERQTTQSLPDALRPRAIANVAAMVRPGGTLLVVAAVRDDDDPDDTGPPWPLTRREIDSYADGGLAPVRIEAFADPDQPAVRRWRAEFRRPAE
jgi:SAM-dependent methyltransferase